MKTWIGLRRERVEGRPGRNRGIPRRGVSGTGKGAEREKTDGSQERKREREVRGKRRESGECQIKVGEVRGRRQERGQCKRREREGGGQG